MLDLLTREYFFGLTARDSELDSWCESKGITRELFWDFVLSQSPDEKVWEVLHVRHDLKRYDKRKVPTSCECQACKGDLTEDPACLYAQMPKFAVTIANIDAELMARFWDLPYYLYALATMQKTARDMSFAADVYCKGSGKFEEKSKSQLLAERSRSALRSSCGTPR